MKNFGNHCSRWTMASTLTHAILNKHSCVECIYVSACVFVLARLFVYTRTHVITSMCTYIYKRDYHRTCTYIYIHDNHHNHPPPHDSLNRIASAPKPLPSPVRGYGIQARQCGVGYPAREDPTPSTTPSPDAYGSSGSEC